MILPFYNDIEHQEFRKFFHDQDILNQVLYYSEIKKLPSFVFKTEITDFYDFTSYIVYVDNFGNEIKRDELINDEISQKLYLGKYLFFIPQDGFVLDFDIEYCRYYLEIQSESGNTYYSEVLTKIKGKETKGVLLQNTGADILLNTGGNILLNDSELGYKVDELTKITASASKNWGDLDFKYVDPIFFVDTRPYLEENFENTISEENAGEETILQKVITSVYSLTFFAIATVADNLHNLSFFDEITIVDPENKEYNVINRPEIILEERVDFSGIYRVKITFQTEYRIDLQIEEQLGIGEDFDLTYMVGEINHTPSTRTIAELLEVKNALLEGTGLEAIQCLGQELLAADYPKAAQSLGVFDDSGTDKVLIPDLQGKIIFASGENTDRNDEVKDFESSLEYQYGTYNESLTKNGILNFHVIGGRLEKSTSLWSRSSFFFKNQDLTTQRDLTGMTDYDNDYIDFGYLIERAGLANDPFGFLVPFDNRFVTTLNDNDDEVSDIREKHNNMQPAWICHVWTIIDKV